MFGRSLRGQIRDLEKQLDTSKRETRAARGDCGIATRDMETWRRRAIENADRVVAAELNLRECHRKLAAYELEAVRLVELEDTNEAVYQEVAGRPALPRQRKARVLTAGTPTALAS